MTTLVTMTHCGSDLAVILTKLVHVCWDWG